MIDLKHRASAVRRYCRGPDQRALSRRGINARRTSGQVEHDQPILVAIGDAFAVGEPGTSPRLPVTIRRQSPLLATRQIHGPQIPDLGPIGLGPNVGQAAAIRRPAGNCRKALAGEPPNVFPVRLRDVNSALSITIRIEGDTLAVRRWTGMEVM